MNILQNKNLIVESNCSGAEITRIYSKKSKRDILWCGDNTYWGRRSPILFPIVGRLKDNKTIIEDNIYYMNQHGFARDMNFKIIEESENSISYQLISSNETKSMYPYSFELTIKYTLIDSTIEVEWTVNNSDTKDIYFSIGAHPAFNIPMSDNEAIEDYYLKLICRDGVENITLNGPYYETIKNIDNIDIINLNPNLFKNDALIYTNIDKVSIFNKENKECLNVELKEFPLVGIWSPFNDGSIAPFICIEPWYGLADNINTDYQFNKKAFINKLEVNKILNTSYKINIF
ncbi:MULTISPECIES: aldose 1-epimerase family protein [unclassified Romboutsia]|uniref:aldose 1-epimerase family protein n=1 Tax=unclassified Romboutsia TaxID=2626894 RepID=UPI00082124B6|nr:MULTISPECIES: aldose 1-epimerase family protein [unclassified Romboutsia]SCH66966.1 Aldose 1-epimerase [uncultured Clostridium sp.]